MSRRGLLAVINSWIRLVGVTTASGRWYPLDPRTTESVENPLIPFGVHDDVYRNID